MNKLLLAVVLAVGSFGLFSGAFVGFARLNGTPAHELPMIGSMFTPPDEPQTGESQPPLAELQPPQGPQHASQAGLGLLDVFRIDSPVEAAELQELARTLKRRKAQIEQREAELEDREQRQGERALFLDEQFASLAELRGGLEQWQLELAERQAEVERDESSRAEREAEGWKRMAKLFEKGEAASLARRLEAWTPSEAAQVLTHLKPDRARELLESVSGERWKDYWEAYRQSLGQEAP